MNERERRGAANGRHEDTPDVSPTSRLDVFVKVHSEDAAAGILPYATEIYADLSDCPHMPLAVGNQILLTIGR